MITKKIDNSEYEIRVYDRYSNQHKVCGWVEWELDENDLRYWSFYPNGELFPLKAGDLNNLVTFIRNLNKKSVVKSNIEE